MTRSPLLRSKPGWKGRTELPSMPVAEVIESTNVIAVDRPVGDARAVAGLQSQAEEAHLRERTREVLTTADAPCDDDTIELVVSHVRRANASYVDAFDSLVETGRMLNRIQQAVGGGGYKALFDSGILRIGEANASKLRQIAGAIDTARSPGSWSGPCPETCAELTLSQACLALPYRPRCRLS